MAGLIRSIRGAYGGYTLAKASPRINHGEIVEVLEGGRIVECLEDPSACPRSPRCNSRGIWDFLDAGISRVLRYVTLEEWLSEPGGKGRGRSKSAIGRLRRRW